MDYSISNQQESLAELVVLSDIQNNFTSYEALLSIKRWKFILRIPGIAPYIKEEADASIEKKFFTYIGNQELLAKEAAVFPLIGN